MVSGNAPVVINQNRLVSDGGKAPPDTYFVLKLLQAMQESDDKQPISGIIQLDDVYWGGERRGGKRGLDAAGKTSGPEQGGSSNQDANDGGRWFQN